MNMLALSLLLMLQATASTVSGTVTKPGGTEPLAGATVILAPANPDGKTSRRTVTSEEDGRFNLRDVAAGDYSLIVQNSRYGSALYGQRKSGGPGVILSVTPGRSISDIRISMVPTGAIAGRITGPSGEPMVNANVQALRFTYESGTKSLAAVQSATTDDRGEYRLFWLPAGRYVVVAAPRVAGVVQESNRPVRPGEANALRGEIDIALSLAMSSLTLMTGSMLEGNITKRILDDGTVVEESWMPTYYPTTTDLNRSSTVDVDAGATTSGINISLGPSRVQNISGRVVGTAPGSLAVVTLVPQSQGVGRPSLGRGASSLDGSFAFSGVIPGTYYLLANDRAGSRGTPMKIQVADRDVENVTIGVSPGMDLRGRITVDGGPPAAPPPRSSNTTPNFTPLPVGGVNLDAVSTAPISLVPDMPGIVDRNSLVSGVLGADGSFRITGLVAGDYLFRVTGVRTANSKPAYVKSIRYGQTDVTDGIHLDSEIRDTLDVVMSTDTGAIKGAVLNRNAPAVHATVVLVPNSRKRRELYKIVATGNDGQFKFQDVPTGDYKLFAWEDVETGAWEDPDFLKTQESKGQSVRVSNQSDETVQLSLITP